MAGFAWISDTGGFKRVGEWDLAKTLGVDQAPSVEGDETGLHVTYLETNNHEIGTGVVENYITEVLKIRLDMWSVPAILVGKVSRQPGSPHPLSQRTLHKLEHLWDRHVR